jgi:MATE family multidrug resistance protein
MPSSEVPPPFAAVESAKRRLPMLPSRRDVRSLTSLAIPVVLVQVGMMSMGVVDTVMVGRFAALDLAAVALGNLYFWLASAFGMGTLMALDPVVAQAVGAGDDLAVSRGVQRGFVLAGMLTLAGAVILSPAEIVLSALRQPAEVVPVAARYAWVAIPGLFPFFAFVVLRQTLHALGRMRPIMSAIVLANLVNVALNWMFVWGNAGFPALGAVGSSLASTLSRWIMAVGLLLAAWPLLGRYLRTFRPNALASRPLIRMLKLGLPIGIQFELEFGMFAVTALLMGLLGTVAMAGHQVAINLASLTFMVPLGIGQATAVLVGHAIGRGDAPGGRRAAGAGIMAGGAFMLLMAVLLVSLPELLASAYSKDVGVLAIAAGLIPLAGLFQVFDGLQVVCSGVLRGIGDTKSPMLINLIGFWGVGLPVGLFLGFRSDLGPTGLWWGLVAGLAVVAVLLLVRVHLRMSRDMERVIIDHEGEWGSAGVAEPSGPHGG